MSDVFSFITDAGKHTYEFFDDLKTIGVEIKNEHVAELYEGESFNLRYQLVLKKGMFSKEVIMGSDDRSDVDTIKDYIGYFPQFNSLTVTEAPLAIVSGNYALRHVSKMGGVHGKEAQIKEIVAKWNGGDDVIDYILNGIEETLLGFFPFSNSKQAKAYTDLINAGAFRESTPEEIAEIQGLVSNFVSKLNKK